MELLRRSLLIGCLLPGLWLLRLAPLDPLVAIARMDPAAQPKQGLADAPTSVSGPEWDLLLRDVDAMGQGLEPADRWRMGPDLPGAAGVARWVFYRPHEKPVDSLQQMLGRGGTAVISLSRPDGDHRYRVERCEWTRRDFGPGAGFTGKPAPPSMLLYVFQVAALVLIAVGILLFALIPSTTREHGGATTGELAVLALALALFAGPLVATGGSVQALTRGLALTLPCWALSAVAIHFFARPGRNAPHPLLQPDPGLPGASGDDFGHLPTFLRWAVVMLAVAYGPMAVLLAVSLSLWNR
jgi:hypothetical protein